MIQPATEIADHRAARERAEAQVSDVLHNLECTMEKAGQAHLAVASDGADANAQMALNDAIRDLARVHSRLMQDLYVAT